MGWRRGHRGWAFQQCAAGGSPARALERRRKGARATRPRPHGPGLMEESVAELPLIRASAISFGMHLVFGIIAIFIGAFAIQMIDKYVLRRINLEEEIARGNLAAAVFAGSVWL